MTARRVEDTSAYAVPPHAILPVEDNFALALLLSWGQYLLPQLEYSAVLESAVPSITMSSRPRKVQLIASLLLVHEVWMNRETQACLHQEAISRFLQKNTVWLEH